MEKQEKVLEYLRQMSPDFFWQSLNGGLDTIGGIQSITFFSNVSEQFSCQIQNNSHIAQVLAPFCHQGFCTPAFEDSPRRRVAVSLLCGCAAEAKIRFDKDSSLACEVKKNKKIRHLSLQTRGSRCRGSEHITPALTFTTAVAFHPGKRNNVHISLLFWVLAGLFRKPAQLRFDSAKHVTSSVSDSPNSLTHWPNWIHVAGLLSCSATDGSCLPLSVTSFQIHLITFTPFAQPLLIHSRFGRHFTSHTSNCNSSTCKKVSVSEWMYWSWDQI